MPSIEEHIRKAMQEGKFDDLPGKGRPLRLDENPHADPEWRLAHKMLHDSGFSLPWIQLRKEIEAGLEGARADLRRAWEWRVQALAQNQPPDEVAAEWGRAQAAFQDEVARLNQQINDYNLQTPSPRFQRRRLDFEKELEEVTWPSHGREEERPNTQ